MSSFKATYKQILSDYPSNDATLFKCLIAKFLNPSYSVVFAYRIGHYFFHSNNRFFKHISSRKRMRLVFKKNCDISFLASIGDRMRLPHPIGVVIGAEVEIGDNVTIFQNVTVGSHGKTNKEKSYPIIEDNVTIYPDSIVVGKIRIGKNSVIGAKTFVNVDVPPNSLAVGIPCRIIKKS